MSRDRSSRLMLPLLIAATAMVCSLFVAGTYEEPAGARSSSFTAISSADAASIEITYSSAPVVPGGQVAFLSPASAQASVSSLGLSTAYASLPYAGSFVPTVPGTVAGASGGQVPAFPFPQYVASSYPTSREQRDSNGAVSLSATSNPKESEGEAAGGGSTGDPAIARIRAHSYGVEKQDGTLEARATSEVHGFAIGPLRIGRIESRAHMTKEPGREPTVTSSMFVADVTVAGTPVGLTDRGIVTGGDAAPLPDGGAVAAALEDAGLELRYVPAKKTADTVESAGVSVRYTTALPNQSTLRIDYVLGRVLASVQSSDAGLAVEETPSGDVRPAALGPITSPAAASPASVSAPRGASRAAERSAAVALAPAGTFSPGPSGMSFYLVLVGAGMAAVACSQLIRVLAVKRPRPRQGA